MKKTLALVLSLLVAFSMFTVVAAAEEGNTVTIQFVYQTPGISDDSAFKTQIGSVTIAAGVLLTPDQVPDAPKEFKGLDSADGKKYKYTFKYWALKDKDGNIIKTYHDGTIRELPTSESVVLVAEYAREDLSGRQSFWNLIESIFERLNRIFEYFAYIFNW